LSRAILAITSNVYWVLLRSKWVRLSTEADLRKGFWSQLSWKDTSGKTRAEREDRRMEMGNATYLTACDDSPYISAQNHKPVSNRESHSWILRITTYHRRREVG